MWKDIFQQNRCIGESFGTEMSRLHSLTHNPYIIPTCWHPILQPAFNLTWRLKGNFALEICILILAIRYLISFHQNDLDVVTIKSTGHKPYSDYQIESYHQIKF